MSNWGDGRAREDRPTVLVVDDEPDVRLLVRSTLEADGRFASILEAEDGQDALSHLRTQPPSIALLDLSMPGMNGREALPRIVSIAPRTMVVMLTSTPRSEAETEVLKAGAFAYVEKTESLNALPRRLADLWALFQAVLEGEDVVIPVPPL